MKSRIPKKFKSLQEERAFWQTHDITDFWSELKPVTLKFGQPRRKRAVRLTNLELYTLKHLLSKLTHA